MPRAFVVMPYYGMVEPGAVEAYAAPNNYPKWPKHHQIAVGRWSRASSSGAPHCFNILLTQALDARDRGEVTHLAMIHQDLIPIDGQWLNRLYAEMVDNDLQVISAVAAIKNDEGKTSCATGPADDPWTVRKYVKICDRLQMPQTFSSETVCRDGEVLLINTGCMLADLWLPCWDDFAFNFVCRIGRDKDGNRQAQFRPDDWEMSRHLHRNGVRYGATWAVRLDHAGAKFYPNY